MKDASFSPKWRRLGWKDQNQIRNFPQSYGRNHTLGIKQVLVEVVILAAIIDLHTKDSTMSMRGNMSTIN